MAYLLNKSYTLEGFLYEPYFVVNESKRFARKLSKDEFNLLMLCDGSNKNDLLNEEQEHIARVFAKQGILSQINPQESDKPFRNLEYEFNDYFHFDTAHIAITGRCNFRCKHCLAATGQENVASQLSLEECRKIFTDMIDARIFNLWFTGGEPLLHPQFKEIVCAASEYGLRIERLFTNASLVNSDLFDFFEECGQHPLFVVSFDGIGTHDWMRNCSGAEERTLKAIDLVLSRGYDVCASICVNGITAPSVIDTCRSLVIDHGVGMIRVIYTSPTPRWVEFAGEKELIDIREYFDLMIELLRVSRVEKWPASIEVHNFPHLHLRPNSKVAQYLRKPPEPRFSKRIMSSCERASSVIFITSDGRVLPCSGYEGWTAAHSIMTNDDVNIKVRPLKDILGYSEFADQYRITIADLQESDPECLKCKWVQICCGGCPLYTNERKFWDAGNPLCVLHKGGYTEKYLNMLEETA